MRKILVVDDSNLNRAILKNILSSDYEVLEAKNGREAIELLDGSGDEFSAVLLDIIMPELDGYGVLKEMRQSEKLEQIPVIVMTGDSETGTEVKALSMGANDFVVKPFNAEVIKRRLWNTINLRETAAIVNATKTDALTGLHSRSDFFEVAAEMISAHEPGYYVMSCFDVDKFKMINDRYGNERGDAVLKRIAKILIEYFEPIGGLCSRINADTFAILTPADFVKSEREEKIFHDLTLLDGIVPPITYSIGCYTIDDPSLSVSAMYDRAAIAEISIKGRFDVKVSVYDESMRNRIISEQKITSEMNSALKSGQFEVWFQPQYNHASGALIGAEALVRWRHPERGLIPPIEFIPVFEKNGFIYELDKFVWERCCAYLREWLDAKYNPLPVSVNISRYDIFRDDLGDVISGLLKKYSVPSELLRLEVTESAFAESTEQIIKVVKDFVDRGFIVEIDDFGSGYSSLNTLKDVPAQVVKLDMRFLEGEDNSARGGNILESIVRMTKWLGMSVIAEGVETASQADYLKTIGCNYVQGYLYARPMPAADYVALFTKSKGEGGLCAIETVNSLDNNAFWNPASIETLIFNSFVGGASVFEYHNGAIEILRVNDKYARALGGESITAEDAIKIRWEDYADGGQSRLAAILDRAVESGEEISDEIKMVGLKKGTVYFRVSMRVIASVESRYLIYSMLEDITAQRAAEKRLIDTNRTLTELMDDMPGGFTRMKIVGPGKIVPVYINEKISDFLDMTSTQLYELWKDNATDSIHPDDKYKVKTAAKMLYSEGTYHMRCRIRNGSGGYTTLNLFGRLSENSDGEKFLNMYYSDDFVPDVE